MIEQRWSQVMQAPAPVVVLAAVDDRHGRHGLTRLAQVWADCLRAALAEPATEHTAAMLASVPVVPLDEEGLLLRVQLADRCWRGRRLSRTPRWLTTSAHARRSRTGSGTCGSRSGSPAGAPMMRRVATSSRLAGSPGRAAWCATCSRPGRSPSATCGRSSTAPRGSATRSRSKRSTASPGASRGWPRPGSVGRSPVRWRRSTPARRPRKPEPLAPTTSG